MAESIKEPKSLLMKRERGQRKDWLKAQHIRRWLILNNNVRSCQVPSAVANSDNGNGEYLGSESTQMVTQSYN